MNRSTQLWSHSFGEALPNGSGGAKFPALEPKLLQRIKWLLALAGVRLAPLVILAIWCLNLNFYFQNSNYFTAWLRL